MPGQWTSALREDVPFGPWLDGMMLPCASSATSSSISCQHTQTRIMPAGGEPTLVVLDCVFSCEVVTEWENVADSDALSPSPEMPSSALIVCVSVVEMPVVWLIVTDCEAPSGICV